MSVCVTGMKIVRKKERKWQRAKRENGEAVPEEDGGKK